MKLGLRIAIGALVITFLALIVWRLQDAAEPHYQGKSLSAWLAQLDDHKGDIVIEWSSGSMIRLDEKQLEAAQAIRHIGTNALPKLVRMIEAKDRSLRTVFHSLVDRLLAMRRHFRSLSDADRHPAAAHIRRRGALGIVALGSAAAPAVPELTYLFTNVPSQSCKDAALALASIGPEGVAPLRTALTNRFMWNSWPAVAALWALAQFPTNGQVIAEQLVEGITNSNRGLQYASVWALSHIHPEPEFAVKALLPGLDDSDVTIRRLTLEALQSYGAQATSAVPVLLKKLPTRDLHRDVLETLYAIDPRSVDGIK